ncbi:MAG TPA: DUF512 domain-containing protein, partial [Candidatus Cloacimonadota bacterium]|nr:DUF512 domain-containing protein [Candidatus Cloacimonadota bacterium]
NPESLPAEAGMHAGDTIISINDHPIRDFIDLQFYSAEENLNFELKDANAAIRHIFIEQDWSYPLGIEPIPHRCRNCVNNCIFCFVDQMRPGIRKTLYIKDDDFRLSFVYGNFITLTNLSDQDFNRIIEQKLSPLYISIHTTNPDLHKRMMRHKQDFHVMEKLKFFSENGIEMHTQIVVVPGWNDGAELQRTLSDLSSDEIAALSIGIVPVGLTKFRDGLTALQNVSPRLAQEIIGIADKFPLTYCSDEIFLLAGKELPEEEYYDDFPQLENGIGMLRLLMMNWQEVKSEFISFLKKTGKKYVFITGMLAAGNIENIAAEIDTFLPGKIRVQPIQNDFLGRSVTVAGLTAACDIFAQTVLQKDEIPVLPGNLLNEDELTIDNVNLVEIMNHFQRDLLIVDEEFADWRLVEWHDLSHTNITI